MKLLYYSVVLNSKHGGSNHANQFIKYASAHPDVDELLSFPKQNSKTSTLKTKKQTWLKRFRFFLIPRFFRRSKHFLNDLILYIEAEKPDVLIMRPDHNFLQLKKLKDLFPHLLLVAEINSSSFDESYSRIPFKRYFQSLEQQTYCICDLNCFVTDELRSTIMGVGLDRSRDLVVYNGTEPDKFIPKEPRHSYRREFGIREDALVMGYMGTLDVHKKVSILIDAFYKLKNDFPLLCLLVVGDGPDRENIELQISRLDIKDDVIITGWVEYAVIEKYLFAMDLAIHHHSNPYCCPLKIFDYMAAELPTIAPNISFISENFIDMRHLIVTEPNADSIYQHVLSILQRPEDARVLAKAGKTYVTENFTWEKSANKIVDQIVLKLHGKINA